MHGRSTYFRGLRESVRLSHMCAEKVRSSVGQLPNAARHASSAATQNIAAAQNASPYNSNIMLQEELMRSCRGIKGTVAEPDSPMAHHKLLTSCQELIPPASQMVSASKVCVPTIVEPACALQLSSSTKQVSSTLADLRIALDKREGCHPRPAVLRIVSVAGQECGREVGRWRCLGPAQLPAVRRPRECWSQLEDVSALVADRRADGNVVVAGPAQETCGRQQQEIDSALERIRELDQELVDIHRAAVANQLRPLPGENSELCALKLGATSKVVGSSMAQLLTAASQGNESYTGTAARDTASALQQLVEAVRGVVASSGGEAQRLVEPARQVLERSCQLLEEARQAVLRPDEPDKQQRLAHVAKSVSAALNACINCLPGQKDVDDVIRTITESSQVVVENNYSPLVARVLHQWTMVLRH
ncbi:hypothetical protein HPB51_017166 [Rhipicephalus microplus]|uniref:Talin n=1 Tax=Rhipicephalus microplus TaxID=6941 RepID=A0A9J6DP10_RHIMP|nr:hypothetical protein HPB51_017166 [Rhipicephalus microplus]